MLSDLFFIPQFASSHDKTQSNFTTDLAISYGSNHKRVSYKADSGHPAQG